ncbi:ATP-binding cassette domain-containing protein [Streptomyces coeruleoprunus]|uniref:ATP-binding cassette domain-containing protein n=1 Tax=Streptomyces coeruleoprunus TaxID=285563 RepID=A0ABV9XR98_9ACTN
MESPDTEDSRPQPEKSAPEPEPNAEAKREAVQKPEAEAAPDGEPADADAEPAAEAEPAPEPKKAAESSKSAVSKKAASGSAAKASAPTTTGPRPRAGAAARGAAITARDFGLKGPRGWAFQGVGVDAAPGDLVAIEGPSGSGRTCLLLALTGRMRPGAGHAEVAGLRLPRKMAAVRRISALAHVPGVSDLDPSFTVAEHLREGALLRRRFDGSPLALLRARSGRAAENRRRIEAALEAAGLDPDALVKGERTSVRDLERLEALRLSVALALIGEPRLLAVDDTDLKLGAEDEEAAWSMLRSVADSGVTVLAVCNEAPAHASAVIRTDGNDNADDNKDTEEGAA